jgi:pimeloyl-ACP methyl ester carboxylesterase
MQTVHSHDGTAIAFDQIGSGPPLITVVGAFNERSTAAPLASSLAAHFSVLTYDRRGRGDSGDTPPYAVQREIEDLAALIEHVGDSAAVFGYSSGACLALEAAVAGLPIARLALFDPPFMVSEQPPEQGLHHLAALSDLIRAGRRGEAVEYFQARMVGIPEDVVAQMRHAPFRPALEAIAHTLVYDATILVDGALAAPNLARLATPTLVIAGGASPFLSAAAQALGRTLPNARVHVLEAQGHDIRPDLLSPLLID